MCCCDPAGARLTVSQLDRFLLAFRRDLVRAAPHGLDHYAQLFWDDRDAFFQAQDAAWASGRAEPYVSLSAIRAQNEVLGPKAARRLAHRYRCELDERFPAYLRQHQGELQDVLL